MDYDKTKVPDTYDAGRALKSAVHSLLTTFFADNLAGAQITDIIDLGCGTGRFSQILADTFDASVTGIDPSEKMLSQARSKYDDDRFTFLAGPAEALPIEAASADLVFMSMVDHHLVAPEKAAREIHRVLRPGGHIFIRNTVSDETTSYPYLSFFPSIRSIIDSSLHSRSDQDARHTAAGFHLIVRQTNRHEMAANWQDFAKKIALRADSFVARLDDDEFADGLRQIEARAPTAPEDEAVELNVDMVLYKRD